MNTIKPLLIAVILLFYIVTAIYSDDQLSLWDKSIIQDQIITFDGAVFKTSDNQTIPLDEVSYTTLDLVYREKSEQEEKLSDISVKELQKRANVLSTKYPDASSVVLLDEGIQKLRSDGSRYSISRYAVKILNESDLSKAILTFYFQTEKHETTIINARSIDPDGTVTNLSESDITYTTPSQGLSFFSGRRDVKYIKAEVPNVSVGSIIDYSWETIESAPEDPDQFYCAWYFGGNNPLYESIYTVVVPEEKELYHISRNFAPYSDKPEVSKKNGYKRYRFVRGESPPLEKEPQSPPDGELIPYIKTSLFPDQQYLSDWLAQFMKERIVISDQIKTAVDEYITRYKPQGEEKTIALMYRFMQEYIQYRSIKTSLSSGFSGHPAAETFANGYGDCIDKSILFTTILNELDITAYPVIVMTNSETQPPYGEIGIVSGNHAINEIHLKDGRIIYLDTTSTTYRYPAFRSDDQGIKAWNAILNTIRYIETLDPLYNTQVFNTEVILSADGSGEFKQHRVYSGGWESGLRSYFLKLKEQEIKALIQSVVAADYPGAVLIDYSYADPNDYNDNFYLDMHFKADNVLKPLGNNAVFVPPFHYSFDFLSLDKRNHPLKFSTTEGLQHTIIVSLPESYSVTSLPDNQKIESGNLTYTADWQQNGNTIKFIDHYKRTAIRVETDNYTQFRTHLLDIEHYSSIPVLLKKVSN